FSRVGIASCATAQTPTVQLCRLPMQFEPNQGQAPGAVNFLARGSGYSVSINATQAVLSLNAQSRRIQTHGRSTNKPNVTAAAFQMALVNGNSEAQIEGTGQLGGVVSYFIGNDPAKWHSGIPTFAKVMCREVYPNIDLVYYGNQRQLE